MALPLTGQAFEIHMVGELISKPYIDITLKLMAQFGVNIINEDYRVFKIPAVPNIMRPNIYMWKAMPPARLISWAQA